jgi:carboxypeptidase Taq
MTMNPRDAYDDLVRRSRERALLSSCSALLGWDEQTYMPPGGAEHRGEMTALLAGLHHERATDPALGERLATVEETELVADPESVEAVNVREWRRDFDRATKLPRDLVEELARTTTLAQQEWVTARRERDYKRFRPRLETILNLKRREAACLGSGPSDYDALIDEYEPGARSADLARLFAALRDELVPLIAAIAHAPRRPEVDILRRDYPIDRQRILGETVASAVGFDFRRGRLDVTEHPFCTEIGPGDCRITTRYHERDFGDAFFSILHEVGHGLYEQGLDPDHTGTPMGQAVSLGVHESQSRLWENAVGRSRPFWTHAFPLARRIFHDALHDVSLDRFHFAINHVEPSLIRVQADEVTYNLHIIVRFELELALLTGDLPLDDLPSAWAEKYRSYLDIAPTDDAEGCLQDVHWAAGLFGYFPTYTLGNVIAAQLFAKARDDRPDLDAEFSRGEFDRLLGWLRVRVHRQGRRFHSDALVRRATGSGLDHRPLIDALRKKYSELYSL